MTAPTPKDQPQKSEVHETTDDATSSPANSAREVNTTKSDPDRAAPEAGTAQPEEKSFEEREKTFPPDVRVRRDLSDEGGPIDVEMD